MESGIGNVTQKDVLEFARRIKADYFAKWDAENEWIFELVDDTDGAQGLACYKEKTIRITPVSLSDLPLLLIHEICHAACYRRNPGHGKHWKNRMLKAAADAENKYGDFRLAEALRNEVEGYNRSERMQRFGKRLLYSEFQDAVIDHVGSCQSLEELLARYEQIEELVRREYGVSQQAFRDYFPRAPKVYEKYAREAWQYCERVAQLRKTLDTE